MGLSFRGTKTIVISEIFVVLTGTGFLGDNAIPIENKHSQYILLLNPHSSFLEILQDFKSHNEGEKIMTVT